ncbi:MAG: hypothetical protein ACO1HP_09555 [Bacteroidota bacterium]
MAQNKWIWYIPDMSRYRAFKAHAKLRKNSMNCVRNGPLLEALKMIAASIPPIMVIKYMKSVSLSRVSISHHDYDFIRLQTGSKADRDLKAPHKFQYGNAGKDRYRLAPFMLLDVFVNCLFYSLFINRL